MASTPGKQTRFIQRNDRYQDVTRFNVEKLKKIFTTIFKKSFFVL